MGMNGPVGAVTQIVHGARGELLAGAGLAIDEHRGIATRKAFDLIEQAQERRATRPAG